MERTHILSARNPATGPGLQLSHILTEIEIRERFSALAAEGARNRTDPDALGADTRGDHQLNPGMMPIAELREAAVLVPLVERDHDFQVLLTQRTEHLAHHAGQIAFPGGRMEPSDADAVATALRETEEEIGLARAHVEPIGTLDRYITRTGFAVTPVVGFVRPPFDLALDPHEVADAFEVPLAFLLDPANRQRHTIEFQGMARYFYAFTYGDRYIWGATAGMLVNLAELLNRAG